MTDINIIVGEEHGHHGHPHPNDHDCPHHDPQEVVPFEKEDDDLPPKEAGDDSRTRELIAQEERASNDYEQLADEADDADTKEVYEDISDEEKVHAGELLVLLLKQDPKQKKALEEGSEEVRELVGGESFRSMFEKGRGAVIAKANGTSIAKAKPKGKVGEKPQKWPTHTEGNKQIEKENRKRDKRLNQGAGHRENPKVGEPSSQISPEKALADQGRTTDKVKEKPVEYSSKAPKERKPYPGKPSTPNRKGPEHDTAGPMEGHVSTEERPTGDILIGDDPMQTALLNDPSKAAYAEAYRNSVQGVWNPESQLGFADSHGDLHTTTPSSVGPGWSPVTNAAGKVPEPSSIEPNGSLDRGEKDRLRTIQPDFSSMDSVKLSLADARKRAAADTPGPGGD